MPSLIATLRQEKMEPDVYPVLLVSDGDPIDKHTRDSVYWYFLSNIMLHTLKMSFFKKQREARRILAVLRETAPFIGGEMKPMEVPRKIDPKNDAVFLCSDSKIFETMDGKRRPAFNIIGRARSGNEISITQEYVYLKNAIILGKKSVSESYGDEFRFDGLLIRLLRDYKFECEGMTEQQLFAYTDGMTKEEPDVRRSYRR